MRVPVLLGKTSLICNIVVGSSSEPFNVNINFSLFFVFLDCTHLFSVWVLGDKPFFQSKFMQCLLRIFPSGLSFLMSFFETAIVILFSKKETAYCQMRAVTFWDLLNHRVGSFIWRIRDRVLQLEIWNREIPLSPYLFIITANILSLLINDAIQHNIISPYNINDKCKLSPYVVNIILCVRANRKICLNLRKYLTAIMTSLGNRKIIKILRSTSPNTPPCKPSLTSLECWVSPRVNFLSNTLDLTSTLGAVPIKSSKNAWIAFKIDFKLGRGDLSHK